MSAKPKDKSAVKVKVHKGGKLSSAEFDATAFGDEVRYRTLKLALVAHHANQRQGTVNTLGRSEVAGSGKKPWAQKHTGRARAGDRKSPIWRGGGTVFGPKPRDYRIDMPVQARRVALRSAVAGKLADGEVVFASFEGFQAPSAKEARKLLKEVGAPSRAVVVLAEPRENVWKSFRNFPGVTVRTAKDLCAWDVVSGGLVVAEKAALEQVAARVAKVGKSGREPQGEQGATA